MISLPLIGYVMKAALRDKLFIALLIMIVCGTSLSIFIGSSAVVESRQFALVFAASGLRFASIIGLILFVVFYIRRAFDTREVDFLLSRPLSRPAFILSHSLAFTLLAIIVAIPVCLAVLWVAPERWSYGAFLWGASLIVEFIIMANAAFFFSMVIASAVGGAMSILGLYVLSRLMGQLLGIAAAGVSLKGGELLVNVMHVISLIVPRLDLMAQTTWLVYGAAGDHVNLAFIILQGIIYTSLLVTAALVDLVRRQF